MKTVVRSISFLALALTVIPPALFALGSMGAPMMKHLMLVAAVLWFATAPRWMEGRGD